MSSNLILVLVLSIFFTSACASKKPVIVTHRLGDNAKRGVASSKNWVIPPTAVTLTREQAEEYCQKEFGMRLPTIREFIEATKCQNNEIIETEFPNLKEMRPKVQKEINEKQKLGFHPIYKTENGSKYVEYYISNLFCRDSYGQPSDDGLPQNMYEHTYWSGSGYVESAKEKSLSIAYLFGAKNNLAKSVVVLIYSPSFETSNNNSEQKNATVCIGD